MEIWTLSFTWQLANSVSKAYTAYLVIIHDMLSMKYLLQHLQDSLAGWCSKQSLTSCTVCMYCMWCLVLLMVFWDGCKVLWEHCIPICCIPAVSERVNMELLKRQKSFYFNSKPSNVTQSMSNRIFDNGRDVTLGDTVGNILMDRGNERLGERPKWNAQACFSLFSLSTFPSLSLSDSCCTINTASTISVFSLATHTHTYTVTPQGPAQPKQHN